MVVLLAVDIGNTNVHLGLYHQDAWVHAWRMRTVADKMPDEYAATVYTFFNQAALSFDQITGVVISSVVPRLTSTFVEMAERSLGQQAVVVGAPGVQSGIRVDVDAPHEVGADRIVNAAAVHHLYGGPAIVIDFGTATTFDAISADGAYLGGAIAPGIGISHDALVAHTAQLYKVALEPPPSPIGRSTVQAMQSGLFLGYIAMIEGLVARLLAALDESAKVIATGGLATLIAQHTTAIEQVAPFLTLDGLRIIYALNTRE
jgi:type III pantothenate kinase